MKKIALLFVLVGLGLFVSSCSGFLENNIEATNKRDAQAISDYIKQKNLQMLNTATGVWYSVNKPTLGRNAQVGDEVTFHYFLYLLDGTRIDSTSRLKNEPAKITLGAANVIAGFLEAMSILKEGERGTFLIPSQLGFGSQASVTVPANSVLKLDLELVKLRSEDQIIDDYVAAAKLPLTEKTSTGLRFLRTLEAPTGTQLKVGLSTVVKYTGYLASTGKQFDSGQLTVGLGDGAVVKGFEEGLLKMRVGEKAVLVFPSTLGYGVNGSNTTIPPYAPLIFNVEIVSAK
ncbi:peptidylprolyl isomerase FKBP-type [Emticicia oligotrophica DSM 17448]|uniref:Peptidyl-prolyl cis-trans isomerase n=1 Tax=Emticicia oligotrophica (strain DSM 17448 / CIP 109782 / MTCC 6937 / GPTSA100-15) TaxID=929562 RepID=A0ABM5N398_EMTOG|nr:FKBP-type peptidyl-prolyl cis-trans isomerase [Emticicia oligotrophica]AFK03904.1 peptidylprolyl isomerase FKBP-type [Emticicia oligotrophica DSM 17448]